MLTQRFAKTQRARVSTLLAAGSCYDRSSAETAPRKMQRAIAFETHARTSAVVCAACQCKPMRRRDDLQSDSHPVLSPDLSRKRRLTQLASQCVFVSSGNSTFRAVCATSHSSYR